MAAPAWSLETLIHTLFTGEKLPGETSDAPPWPLAWDDEYRRSMVISHIDQDYGELPQAIDALRRFAESGDVPEARIRCVELLGVKSQVIPLIEQLLEDEEPELRLYAIEYLLVNEPERFAELEQRFRDEEDFQIQDVLAIFKRGEPIPLYCYAMPEK